MNFLVIILALFLILTGCQNQPSIKGIEASIKRVVSGQTIEIIIDNTSYQLRLTAIDIPDNQSNLNEEAKQFLVNFFTLDNTIPLKSAKVIVETDLQVKDKYNRLNGYVWYLDRMVNQELIKQGYGIPNLNYTDGKFDRALINAQDYARIMEKGMWKIEK
ncbi:thermonuclease family protein [Geminocystis sp. CENA526]|uniref:thermonuclease family protein n=1 Tax=Geminocystis sp. CENA526 TaxID=1355871 RepID=UPI003D6EFC62